MKYLPPLRWLVVLAVLAIPTAAALSFFVPCYRQSRAIAALRNGNAIVEDPQGTYRGLKFLEDYDNDWFRSGWCVTIHPETDLRVLPHLLALHQITVITVTGKFKLSNDDARLLFELPVEWVDVSDTELGDAELGHLKSQAALHSFNGCGTRIGDGTLEKLGRCPNLRILFLDTTPIKNSDLRHLTGLKNLLTLSLNDTQIGDAGLEHLAGLTELRRLTLYQTRVTDSGLAHLKGLNLGHLELQKTSVNGKGMVSLAGVPLSVLDLTGCQIDDAGLANLAAFQYLSDLDLSNTRVTYAGLKSLMLLRRLETLTLDGTAVGDAGIEQLALLPKLRNLSLSGTAVSDAGATTVLHDCKALHSLTLNNTRVTDALAAAISMWHGGTIEMTDTQFSDAGFKQILKRNGVYIYLRYTSRTADGRPGSKVLVDCNPDE